MNVEDQVHARIRTPRHALGLGGGDVAWLPRKERAVRIERGLFNREIHAGKPGFLHVRLPPCGTRTVENDARVVDDARVAWANLNGSHPSRRSYRHGDDEIPENLLPGSGEMVWLRYL